MRGCRQATKHAAESISQFCEECLPALRDDRGVPEWQPAHHAAHLPIGHLVHLQSPRGAAIRGQVSRGHPQSFVTLSQAQPVVLLALDSEASACTHGVVFPERMSAFYNDKICSIMTFGNIELPWVRHYEGMSHGLHLIQGPAFKIKYSRFFTSVGMQHKICSDDQPSQEDCKCCIHWLPGSSLTDKSTVAKHMCTHTMKSTSLISLCRP